MRRNRIVPVVFLISISRIAIALGVDTPSETFFVDVRKIHPQALRGVKGIISIHFVETFHAIMKDHPAEIVTYTFAKEGSRGPSLALTLSNIRPLSGMDWEDQTIRRFPVMEIRDEYYRIVYDVEKNLQAWILCHPSGFVRITTGHWVRGEFTWLKFTEKMNLSANIFFLLDGKPRKFYEQPRTDSPAVDVSNEDEFNKLPNREEREVVSNIYITQIKNGFAKVYTQGDCGAEPKFAGWIKIVENGQLTIWRVVLTSC
jgi:hypothetical protein